MRIQIEEYRGHVIEYDDYRDKFVCDMAIEDNFREKTSLKLTEVRKAIDQFIKLNKDFKPFSFIDCDFRPVHIVALRVDGKFVDDNKNQWGLKEIKYGHRYGRGSGSYEVDAEIMDEINALEKEFEAFRVKYFERKKAIQSKYKPFDISGIADLVPAPTND